MLKLARLPLLLLGAAGLVTGIWGGLMRMNAVQSVPVDHAGWLTHHGALMVCGFFGTLIALERAVAVGRTWAYAAPLFAGVGALVVALTGETVPGAGLLVAGSAIYAIACLAVVRRHATLHAWIVVAGAASLVTGTSLWAAGRTVPTIVPWWIGFIVLTVFGERIELSRRKGRSRWRPTLCRLALGTFVAGLVTSLVWADTGARITGGGALLLALWLLVHDDARREIHESAQRRFTGLCLIAGFVWLGVAGGLLVSGIELAQGLPYDALVHAVFLGFAFSMLFGHGPTELPAILGIDLPYRRTFYVHAVLLQLSVAARVGADLAGSAAGRTYSGILAAAAIGLFIVTSITSAALARR